MLVGSLLVGCTIGDSGTGGGDDEGGGACGDGLQQAGEACDDGNSLGGDGCSATCSVEAVPRLDMVIDNPAVMTELKTTHMLTATLVGSGGFGGAVNLTATVVDAANVPLPGWTVTLDNATVNVPADGSVNAVATLTVPSENKGLTGTVKIEATSDIGPKSVSSTITALNQVTFGVTLNGGGTCVYPTAGTVRVTTGTKVRFLNKAADNITIHIGGDTGNARTGLNHQPDPGSATDTAYEQTMTGIGMVSWYCHAPGPTVNNLLIQGVAP